MTFLCGRGGVYALGAVVANIRGDHHKRDLFLDLFSEVQKCPFLVTVIELDIAFFLSIATNI